MGCWHETCAVTRYPIAGGDSVFMVVLKPDVLPAAWWQDSRGFGPYLFRSIEAVEYGTYDDYGWINEVAHDQETRPDLRSVFVFKPVMDEIVKLHPTTEKNYVSREAFAQLSLVERFKHEDEGTVLSVIGPKPKHASHLESLVLFALEQRLDLASAVCYKGSQHSPKNYAKLIQMMSERHKEGESERDQQEN